MSQAQRSQGCQLQQPRWQPAEFVVVQAEGSAVEPRRRQNVDVGHAGFDKKVEGLRHASKVQK